MFSPMTAFSQGGKPAGRVEVLSIAQHPSTESGAVSRTDPRSAIKQGLLDHCTS